MLLKFEVKRKPKAHQAEPYFSRHNLEIWGKILASGERSKTPILKAYFHQRHQLYSQKQAQHERFWGTRRSADQYEAYSVSTYQSRGNGIC